MYDQRSLGRRHSPRTEIGRYSHRISNEDRFRLKRGYSAARLPENRVAAPEKMAPEPDSDGAATLAVENEEFKIEPIDIHIDSNSTYALPAFRTKRSKLQLTFIGMAFAIFGLALLINIETLQTSHDTKAQVSALASQGGGSGSNLPGESKPGLNCSNYRVGPMLPKCIKIPKIGVNAIVRTVGVNSKNQLQAPYNIYDTGWYRSSAYPGDSGVDGAMLIDGHVHGPTKPGVFSNIKKLAAGDTIQVVRGDKRAFNYKVVSVRNYNAKTMNMGTVLSSAIPGKPGLNLMTCGGPFDRSTWEYTQRTVVFAVEE